MNIDEKKQKNKKKMLIILLIILVIFIVGGISYAYWATRSSLETIDSITTGCLKIKYTDLSDGITIQNGQPISDSEGESLSPYEFNVENICTTNVSYDVNLEIMNATNRLASKYVAVDFNGNGKTILSNYKEVSPTYGDDDYTAVEARKLTTGTLNPGDSVSYNIKLWMDESTTSSGSMNTSFLSKITVSAHQIKQTLAEYITELAKADTINLIYDGTSDNNIRYIGSDPDNYLCFDSNCTNGKWRVIGIMNNMTTSEGELTSLIKIIRDESIGYNSFNYYSPSNIWADSSLNTYLNNDWYITNLKDFDDLIESVVWNLGGYNSSSITASEFYTYERGTIVYEGNPTTWTGKLALMYPSDYGYATSGGDVGRDICLGYSLYDWYYNSDCGVNNYLYNGSYDWTLMPYSGDQYKEFILYSYYNSVTYSMVFQSQAIRPAAYLNSDVRIENGDGTIGSPWIVTLD